MSEKNKNSYTFAFRTKGDYVLFIWVVMVAGFVGFASKYDLGYFFYFSLGLFVSFVCNLWIYRNHGVWKNEQNQRM